jgi:flagella basal body P-ring formation protein FlgA
MRTIIRAIGIALILISAGSAQSTSVNEKVIDFILETYRLDRSSHEIELLSSQLKTDDDDIENLKVSISALTQGEPLGLFTVNAEIRQGNHLLERGQVRVRICKFAEVFVAAHKINRHDKFSEESLTLKRVDITSLGDELVTDPSALGNHRFRRNVRKGKVIAANAIEPVPVVENGREVEITFTNGMCTITATGLALKSGLAGDYIKVKNRSSGKIIVARIKDGSSVIVD